MATSGRAAPAWRGYGANAQHTAAAPAVGDPLETKLWRAKLDLAPQIVNGDLFIHYASPMITAHNTVLIAVKTGPSGGFRMEARRGKTGALVWQTDTNFVPAPHDWMPSYPAHLTRQNRLYFAGGGGTVLFRDTPNSATGNTGRRAFYGLSVYKAHRAALNRTVMIDTPITADDAGNIFFGFVAESSNPANLVSGIARISADGKGTWISAADAASDSEITQVAQNCAPAISRNGKVVYIAVSDGRAGYLLELDSVTLARRNKVRLIDPNTHQDAFISDDSSAAPTIGPDGDVYYGVLETAIPQHNDRGWLLHFSANLRQTKTPGSFGWDDTVSVVPASSVPSYNGTSPYLIVSKYNNYLNVGSGDGHNEIAILDPNATEPDPVVNSVLVMKEVMVHKGPTHFPGAPAGAVYEWCINSAVVDAAGHAVYANAEDGHTYRWNLDTGAFTGLRLNAPRGEAYTPTLIGPDGTVYAVNNSTLYAVGALSKAQSVNAP